MLLNSRAYTKYLYYTNCHEFHMIELVILTGVIVLAVGTIYFLEYDFGNSMAHATSSSNMSISALTMNITGGNMSTQNSSGTVVLHLDNASISLMMHPCLIKKPGCPF
jgi:hypothetical protein